MKIFINRQVLDTRYLLIILSLFWFSCKEDDTIEYDTKAAITQKVSDAFVQVTTPVVGFQAGTPNYDFTFNAINGTKTISEVKVYSIYTDAASGKKSNEVLLKTFDVEGPTRNEIVGNVSYSDLKSGLTVNGSPLPESDVDLKVGSGWKLRFEGVTPSGQIVPLAGNINIAVLSRFAGIYKVINSDYYRVGVATAKWTGQERYIGSVNETTFSYNDFWGSFAWTGKKFNFVVDFGNNSITVPLTVDGIFAGTRAINCKDDGGLFTSVPCAGSNVLIPNDVTGKHRIKLTYGYYTDGSGPREFYEELEKK